MLLYVHVGLRAPYKQQEPRSTVYVITAIQVINAVVQLHLHGMSRPTTYSMLYIFACIYRIYRPTCSG